MNTKELFNGMAVVIDDDLEPIDDDLEPEYKDSKSEDYLKIKNIVDQIESERIPVVTYSYLPDSFDAKNFRNISFLLLDWKLLITPQGVKVPDDLQAGYVTQNIEFIKKLNQECFFPIFIVTNEDEDSIREALSKENLMVGGRPSNLFFLRKSVLQDDTLFERMSQWLQETPSVYVLKEWEREYQDCKAKFFAEFSRIHPYWPRIMWDTFREDGANKSLEMGELISRNLHSRMTPFEFDEEILEKNPEDSPVPREQLEKVLEGEKFLKNENLHEEDINIGDLFKVRSQDKNEYAYYLNIRAQCDYLRKREKKVKLYCLKGRIFSQDESKENGQRKKKDVIKIEDGHFLEKTCHSIVPFLDSGKVIEFLFYDLEIKKWKELKDFRIGRLLPPYINNIQQRYALYMQRQGLPRIPDEIAASLNEQLTKKEVQE